MSGHPILLTERLVLRVPEAGDLDGWAEMTADAETMRFIGGRAERSEAWRQLCTMRGAWDIRGCAMFSVIERASGKWIGRVGPWEPADWPAPEIGWGVHPHFAGKGYAYEASAASMDYVFEVLRWPRVIHCIDPANVRSQALAARLGSRNLGPTRLPAPYQDHPVDAWGQSADAWRAARASRAPAPRP